MKRQLNVHNAVVLLVSHETSAEFFNSRRLNRIRPHISSRLFIKSPFPFEKINTTITGLSSLLNFLQLFKRETFSQIKLHLKRRYSAFYDCGFNWPAEWWIELILNSRPLFAQGWAIGVRGLEISQKPQHCLNEHILMEPRTAFE